jgi:hypothetical protein
MSLLLIEWFYHAVLLSICVTSAERLAKLASWQAQISIVCLSLIFWKFFSYSISFASMSSYRKKHQYLQLQKRLLCLSLWLHHQAILEIWQSRILSLYPIYFPSLPVFSHRQAGWLAFSSSPSPPPLRTQSYSLVILYS